MSTLFILGAKELNGGIYVTRLPKAIVNPDGSVQPGIPDNWYFVGPGTNPNVQEYNGTQFILTFTYLTHLNVRIMDIGPGHWPPSEVVPITNPPTITIGNNSTGSGAPQDSLTLKIQSGGSFGLVQEFFRPPVIANPLLFLDPTTFPLPTYSVTILPIAGWVPDPPALTSVFYRLYVRPFPYTGPWILTTDWTLSNVSFPWFSFPFSSMGSLRDQFSVTWGTQFSFTDQWNPNAHAEGIPGEYFVTVDSTTQHVNAQAFINEMLTLDFTSTDTFGIFGPRQAFIVEAPSDFVEFGQRAGTGFSVPLVGDSTFFTMLGNHIQFVQLADQADELVASAAPSFSQPNAYQQGTSFGYFGVRI